MSSKRQKKSAVADDEPAKKQKSSDETEEVTVQTMKAGIPLDEHVPQSFKMTHHVLREGENVWDAKLNFSNTSANNNKFYIIQLLEPDSGSGEYLVWTRWGRVGAAGQNHLDHYSSKDVAQRQFQAKFKDKTGGQWVDRDTMVRDPKKYYYLKTSYDFDSKGTQPKPSTEQPSSSAPPPECKLPQRLQELIKLVCNVDEMARQMTEIGYDAKKLPLGKLADSTIRHGQSILQKLSDVISGKESGNLNTLSDEFYSVIPHDFGFQKMSSFVIRTMDDVKKKMEMLQSLSEVAFATRLLSDVSSESQMDKVTASYLKLACGLDVLPASKDEFDIIKRYMVSTVGNTAGHTHYKLEIEDVFAVDRKGETERFQKGLGGKLGNHQLLWHGSRLSNWVGILSKGLMIAPPEAPVTGYMFGKGVYFADMVTKSANYCFVSKDRSTGLLVLCEVALGEVNELLGADYDAAGKLGGSKHATKGVGRAFPSKKEMLPDGSCSVPMGPVATQDKPGVSLQYNEYIVYSLDQVRMRYLVRVKFNFK